MQYPSPHINMLINFSPFNVFCSAFVKTCKPFFVDSRVTTHLTIRTIITVNGNLMLTLVLGDTNLANIHMYSYSSKCIALFAFTICCLNCVNIDAMLMYKCDLFIGVCVI